MDKETQEKLQIYYGNLMYDFEKCNDHFPKIKIARKMKAIECLLDITSL